MKQGTDAIKHIERKIKKFSDIFKKTSTNGNIFRATGPFWGESTGHRWIPLTKASDAELCWYLWSAPEQPVE